MEAIELKLTNQNNCLACDAFLKINFAPKPLIEKDFETVYLVKHEGIDIYLKLIRILRVSFINVTSIMTLPATGLESHEWRKQWKSHHPNTTDETEMCVYYYKRFTTV